MKQSGIDWIGEIPDDWKIIRLKHIFQIKKDIAGKEGFTVLSVTQTGIRPKDMSSKGQFALDYSKYQLVNSGEFIMNHMDLKTGWIDISKYNGVTSPDYRVFYLTDKNCVKDYYKQIFQYCYKNLIFFSLGQGVADLGRWRLPAEMFNNFKLPLPPKATQQRIAEYLDKKVSEIDSIIEESKKSIEEYKAWKQSVIFEAVTGKCHADSILLTQNSDEKKEIPLGISNPCGNKMKDSGIEWIGEIPEGWKCLSLKNLCSMQAGKNLISEQIASSGLYPVYGGNGIRGWYDDFNTDGDYILIGRQGALCGNVHKVSGKFWATEHAVVTTPKRLFVMVEFLYYLLVGMNLNQYASNSAAQPGLSVNAILNVKTILPPLHEQESIAKMLDKKCAEIDSIIAEKESLIADLTEYKKSLIFEVVTGKRSV
ncbi:MAG: restriction endonuclease subunit S [Treponema sp.]|nr:restriction endonuclease subunit S [Treponema sp.]